MGIYLRKLYTTVFLLGIILQFSAQNRFSEGESSEYQGGGASYEVAVPNEMVLKQEILLRHPWTPCLSTIICRCLLQWVWR